MADLFGLSPADRDTLMRMIARERANYTADVRSLAPVPRPRVIYTPAAPLIYAGLTNSASQAYTYGGERDIKFSSAWTSDQSVLSPKLDGGYYTSIELAEPANYLVLSSLAITQYWSIASESTDWRSGVGNAWDDWIADHQLRDKNGSDHSAYGNQPTRGSCFTNQWSCVALTSCAIMSETSANLFPMTVRLHVQTVDHDFTTNAGGSMMVIRLGNSEFDGF